jgi:hypothetical protein
LGTKSMKPITQPQLRKIYAEAREAGFSNDDLHDILYRVNGKESLKDLLMSEAALLIDALVKFNSGDDDRPGMMTDKQKWLLTDYQCKLGWTDAQMRGFIRKYAHVDFMQWLTKEGASKIIEAVKNIYTKQRKVEVSGNVK